MRSSRRAYLDWLRGIAVVCMIEWHVLDAWSVPAAHETWIWPVFQSIGGFAAPLFLFLAGLAVPFAIESHRRRGVDPGRAAWLVQRRGWQVFGIAHLFRLQSFVINLNAHWSTVLKPDILNILGLGLAGTAFLVGRAVRGGSRARLVWLLLPTVMVIALTPFAASWWWPSLLYVRFEAYIRPVGDYGVFQLFPWIALVPAGAFVGLLLTGERDDAAERRLHLRLALAGVALAAAGLALGAIGNPAIAFWTSRWATFVTQVGVMTAAIWLAWAWIQTPVARFGAAPLVLFGRTSLFVYWLHVELAFGGLSYPLHHALSLPWALIGLAGMFVLMYFAAGWWSKRESSRVQRPGSGVRS